MDDLGTQELFDKVEVAARNHLLVLADEVEETLSWYSFDPSALKAAIAEAFDHHFERVRSQSDALSALAAGPTPLSRAARELESSLGAHTQVLRTLVGVVQELPAGTNLAELTPILTRLVTALRSF